MHIFLTKEEEKAHQELLKKNDRTGIDFVVTSAIYEVLA